jgi:hypothetical protein
VLPGVRPWAADTVSPRETGAAPPGAACDREKTASEDIVANKRNNIGFFVMADFALQKN